MVTEYGYSNIHSSLHPIFFMLFAFCNLDTHFWMSMEGIRKKEAGHTVNSSVKDVHYTATLLV